MEGQDPGDMWRRAQHHEPAHGRDRGVRVALETIDEGHLVSVYSDSSYLVNCMRRGWHEKWRQNGWLNNLKGPVANRDLWKRLLEATERHRQVRWRKVKGHAKTAGPHKSGNDRADTLAGAAKRKEEDALVLRGAGGAEKC